MSDKTGQERKQIASRLRLAREAAGLSQGQVAKKLSVHRPTISEVEAGRRRVSAEELVQFADLYGVDVQWITSPEGSQVESPSSDRLLLAARQLARLKDEDLDRLMSLLQMLRQSEKDE